MDKIEFLEHLLIQAKEENNSKAMYNTRLVNGKYTFEGEQVAIDGEGEVTYDSLCPKCYFEEKEKYLVKAKK